MTRIEDKRARENISQQDDRKWFLTLGHSNWTICSLLSRFCSKNFPLVYLLYWEVQFLITPERGRKVLSVAAGPENGGRESPKSERGTGFFDPGVFILDHLQTVKLILFQKIPLFYLLYWEV